MGTVRKFLVKKTLKQISVFCWNTMQRKYMLHCFLIYEDKDVGNINKNTMVK